MPANHSITNVLSFNLNLILVSSRFARQKTILDFGVSNMPISEFWVTYWRQFIFSQCH